MSQSEIQHCETSLPVDRQHISDRAATNNIMVFNLQPQAPHGVAGDHGAARVYAELQIPWSEPNENVTRMRPETGNPPTGRQPERPVEMQLGYSETANEGHLQKYYFQGQGDAAGFLRRGDLDASGSSLSHVDFDQPHFQQTSQTHHQLPVGSVQVSDTGFPQSLHPDHPTSVSYVNHMSPMLLVTCGDSAAVANAHGVGYSKQVIKKPIFPPVLQPKNIFKIQGSQQNPPCCQFSREDENREKQTQRTYEIQKDQKRNTVQNVVNEKRIQPSVSRRTLGNVHEVVSVQSSCAPNGLGPCSSNLQESTQRQTELVSELYLLPHSARFASEEETTADRGQFLTSRGSYGSAPSILKIPPNSDSSHTHLQSAETDLVPHPRIYVQSTGLSVTMDSKVNQTENFQTSDTSSKELPTSSNIKALQNFGQRVQDDSCDDDADNVVYLGTDYINIPPSQKILDNAAVKYEESCVSLSKEKVCTDICQFCGAVQSQNCVHEIQSVSGNKKPPNMDSETDTSSEAIEDDSDTITLDIDQLNDSVSQGSGSKEPEVRAGQLPSHISEHKHSDSVKTVEEWSSDIKIVETVSLAGYQPTVQTVSWQQLSAEGFYRCGCQLGNCAFRSQLQPQFESHLREEHMGEVEYPCVHCGSREQSPDDLMFHLDQHLDFQRFSLYCTEPTCSFHSSNPDSVVNHMAVSHPNLGAHMCWHCSQGFGCLQQFTSHIKRSLLQVAICPHCDAKDTDGQRILKHITSKHSRQVRMIVFNKLLVCRERKLSGWQDSRSLQNSANENIDRSGIKISENSGKKKNNKNKGVLVDEIVSEKQRSVSSAVTRDSDKKCSDSYIISKGYDSGVGEAVGSTENGNMLSQTNEILPDMGLKLHLSWNKSGLKIVSGKSSMTETDRVEVPGKLGMEPMDYEISGRNSVDGDMEDHEDVPSDVEGSTPSASKSASSSTLTTGGDLDQSKEYSPPVTSAGKTLARVCKRKIYPARACKITRSQQIDPKTEGEAMKKLKPHERFKPTCKRNQEKLYTCKLCSYAAHSSPAIYNHMYSKHEEILRCPLCDSKSTNRTSFYNHLVAFHAEQAQSIYKQKKVTNWISTTPAISVETAGQQAGPTIPSKVLDDQHHADVKDFFRQSGSLKDRSFHCMFCQFSFKKYHKSNALVYRSMYKHMFLKHIPHQYQCPHCSFSSFSEDKVRKHIGKLHGDEQEPEVVILQRASSSAPSPKPTDKTFHASLLHKLAVRSEDIPCKETSTLDAPSSPQQGDEDGLADLSQYASLNAGSLFEQVSSTDLQHSFENLQPASSKSVFPERERASDVLGYSRSTGSAEHDAPVLSPPSNSSQLTGLSGSQEKSGKLKPRDLYSVESSGNLHTFRCLRCPFSRTVGPKRLPSQRTSIILHVRRHMKKRKKVFLQEKHR